MIGRNDEQLRVQLQLQSMSKPGNGMCFQVPPKKRHAGFFFHQHLTREDCARSIGETYFCVWLHSFNSSIYRKRERQMRALSGPLGQSRYVYTLQSIETQQVQCGSVKTYGSIFVVVRELFFSPGPKQSVWSISICVWWQLCKNLLISMYFHFLISPFVQIEVYHVLCVCFGPAISIDMIISKSRLTVVTASPEVVLVCRADPPDPADHASQDQQSQASSLHSKIKIHHWNPWKSFKHF